MASIVLQIRSLLSISAIRLFVEAYQEMPPSIVVETFDKVDAARS